MSISETVTQPYRIEIDNMPMCAAKLLIVLESFPATILAYKFCAWILNFLVVYLWKIYEAPLTVASWVGWFWLASTYSYIILPLFSMMTRIVVSISDWQQIWCTLYTAFEYFQTYIYEIFFIFGQEYIQDGIDWTKVEFEDNQACLNLFEKVIYGFLLYVVRWLRERPLHLNFT